MSELGSVLPLSDCFTSSYPTLPETTFYFLLCAPLPRLSFCFEYTISPILCVCFFLLLFQCVRLSVSLSLWSWGMCVLQILCQWHVGRVQAGLGYSMWISFSSQVRLDHHTRRDLLFRLHPTAPLPFTSLSPTLSFIQLQVLLTILYSFTDKSFRLIRLVV